MGTPSEDFARLLEAVDPVELDLARGLLDEAGIPCMAHGPDFDVAELGRAVHATIRKPDLYVPRGALERAREVLRAAWGNARFAGGWSPPARAGAAWGMVIATAEEARTRAFLRATRVHVGEALLSAMEDRMRSRGAVVWFGLTELGNDPMINLLRRRGARPGDPVHVQGEDMIPWEIDLDRGSDRGA